MERKILKKCQKGGVAALWTPFLCRGQWIWTKCGLGEGRGQKIQISCGYPLWTAPKVGFTPGAENVSITSKAFGFKFSKWSSKMMAHI